MAPPASLTAEQVGFFKSNGYLIVPAAMDPALCAAARDLMWSALPAGSSLEREDPATHVGPLPEAEWDTSSLHFRDAYRWQNRSAGVSGTVIDLIYSENISAMVRQLLGGELRAVVKDGTPMGSRGPAWPGGPTDPALGTQGARGIYCTLPYGDNKPTTGGCHTDGHPFQLGVVGLLDDTPADGGAFTVWPGSHARLFHTFKLRYDQLPSLAGIVHTDEYLAELDKLQADTAPVPCWGKAGDIVFWHHRTAHMAGPNHSRIIRQAVLGDFWTSNFDALRAKPVSADMWEDWAEALGQSDGGYSEAFARTQHL